MLFQTLATRNKDEFVFPGEVSWLKALTLLQQMRQVVEIDVLSVNTATQSDRFLGWNLVIWKPTGDHSALISFTKICQNYILSLRCQDSTADHLRLKTFLVHKRSIALIRYRLTPSISSIHHAAHFPTWICCDFDICKQ